MWYVVGGVWCGQWLVVLFLPSAGPRLEPIHRPTRCYEPSPGPTCKSSCRPMRCKQPSAGTGCRPRRSRLQILLALQANAVPSTCPGRPGLLSQQVQRAFGRPTSFGRQTIRHEPFAGPHAEPSEAQATSEPLPGPTSIEY